MSNTLSSAPGKIILFGEHAVVYRRPAIAVPVVNVQAQAWLTPRPEGRGLAIIAPDLGERYEYAEADVDDARAQAVRSGLDYLQLSSAPDAELHLTSTIPLGRGLGSGAAISTAIIRTLAAHAGQEIMPDKVSHLVYEVEKLYHGTPSGIDNTVVAFAEPVYFTKGEPIERLTVRTPLTLVIGDTGVVAPTHEAVGDLRRRWEQDPAHYERIFDEIGAIAKKARAEIERPDGSVPRLGALMNANQRLLTDIGISSSKLDRLVDAARQAEALGAKLSGAGWGGNMIALTLPDDQKAIENALLDAGATAVITTALDPRS